jgi:mono/diheme cytochrome c family protein
MNYKKIITALLLALGLNVVSTTLSANRIGETEFKNHCAVCHGTDGSGNGPILDFLKQVPPDLTKISQKNRGRFPAQKVYDTIVYINKVRGHGNSEMPIWGERYNREQIRKEGEFGSSVDGVAPTQARVLELVFFLATIQE